MFDRLTVSCVSSVGLDVEGEVYMMYECSVHALVRLWS